MRWTRKGQYNATQDSSITWWLLTTTWHAGWFDTGFGSYLYCKWSVIHILLLRFYKDKIYAWKCFDNTGRRSMDECYIWEACLHGWRLLWRMNRLWTDGFSTQWLSWPHIPIVSRGHYWLVILRARVRWKSKSEMDISNNNKCNLGDFKQEQDVAISKARERARQRMSERKDVLKKLWCLTFWHFNLTEWRVFDLIFGFDDPIWFDLSWFDLMWFTMIRFPDSWSWFKVLIWDSKLIEKEYAKVQLS